VTVAGAATVVFGILVKVIGILVQIRQNFRRKPSEGVSFANRVAGFRADFFWTVYGLLRHDTALICGQALGVFTTGVVLCQFALYGRRGNRALTGASAGSDA
jgi:uncharacterized protein with PQ loop repeat